MVESALRVVERRRIADVLRVENLGEGRGAEKELHVGGILGSDYLILGSVQIAGVLGDPETRLQVSSRVVGVRTGEIVGGQSLTLEGKMENLFSLQSELALRYCEILGVKPLAGEKERINQSGTTSYEAYRLFCLGNIELDKQRVSKGD